MRDFVSAACGLWLVLAGPLAAQTPAVDEGRPGVVVELFTSQGCSACPPADEFLARLAQDPGVIPLSLHVDYWDYIGWEDSFGDARFTERQKAYARAIGSRTIYTPQMVVSGVERVEGNQPEQVEHSIRARQLTETPVTLRLSRQGGRIAIHAEADPPLTEGVRVQVVRYLPIETVGIERGENAGMTVVYANIVTSWQVLGDWNGRDPLDITAPVTGDEPVVVILQRPGPGEIVAASRLLPGRSGQKGGNTDSGLPVAAGPAGGSGLALRADRPALAAGAPSQPRSFEPALDTADTGAAAMGE